ncbi:MAG: hypothetical protein MUO64_13885 [Anaerolineales bacterium]|nr:hypothetical protein [Anaerolineales bacterium]
MTLHKHKFVAELLQTLDLGSSIAEQDTLLETARVETSAFSDLWHDKVDLIPGTKGSGKSALFRIFVDFLPQRLLQQRKVVIAHGVQKHGDSVFHAFKDEFDHLSEDEFVSFWCIYLTSLAYEQFIKGAIYQDYLKNAQAEINRFREACATANIPEIKAKKSLKEILAWTLNVLRQWSPQLRYKLPDDAGEVELDLFGKATSVSPPGVSLDSSAVPRYVSDIKDALEGILKKSELSIWLMIDRLDEIFPRRSLLETRALRGLLRSLRLFTTDSIRVKIFLRDDMLEQVVSTEDGFTALTHITARQADTLRWPEDHILTMVVKRIFADDKVSTYLEVDKGRIDASQGYRHECFYKVFPATVHSGHNQSPTLRWMYTHTMDGRGVVTPRDVLDLITKAKQSQQDEFNQTPDGESPWLIGPKAILHGLEELSKRKRDTYLKAEFPHLWLHIEKLEGGKTEYFPTTLQKLLGKKWEDILADLISIGLVQKYTTAGHIIYRFPYVYRKGLDLTQGRD